MNLVWIPVSSVSIYQTQKPFQLSPFLYKTKTMWYSVCITITLIQCRSLAFYWVQMTFSKLNMGQLERKEKAKERQGEKGREMGREMGREGKGKKGPELHTGQHRPPTLKTNIFHSFQTSHTGKFWFQHILWWKWGQRPCTTLAFPFNSRVL